MSSRVLRFSPILAHPKLDTLRDIPLAIYRDICLNDDRLNNIVVEGQRCVIKLHGQFTFFLTFNLLPRNV
jgi:hypothetical protein